MAANLNASLCELEKAPFPQIPCCYRLENYSHACTAPCDVSMEDAPRVPRP